MVETSKRRKFAIATMVALILAVIGFGVSLFLIPNEQQVEKLIAAERTIIIPSAPGYTEKGLQNAKQQFLDQLTAGNITFDTAKRYADMLLADEQPQEAAHVWKEYLEINTQDLAAWKEFATLSEAAKDEASYLLALEIIAKIDPSEENFAALSNYQNYKKDYIGQVATLKKLVSLSNGSNPRYLLDLADIALLTKDDETALAALTTYYGPYANAVRANGVGEMVQPEEGATSPQEEPAQTMGDALPPSSSNTLGRSFESAASRISPALSSAIRLMSGVTSETANATPPPPPPPPALVGTATDAAEAAESAGKSATSLIDSAAEALTDAGDEMNQSFTDGGVAITSLSEPAESDIGAGNASNTAEASSALMIDEPAQGYTDRAAADSVDSIEPYESADNTTATATSTDPAPETLQIQTSGAESKAIDYSRFPTYIRLLAQAERGSDALTEALAHAQYDKAQNIRADIANVLLFEVGPDTAVEYIQTLSAQQDVPEDLRGVYANALVQQGKHADALPVLQHLSAEGADYKEWYFLALSAAAKKDSDARRDLIAHIKEGFAAGKLTEPQKLDRVYALLNAGEKSRALDYTERFMHASEDADFKPKWVNLYKALTVKPKPVRVARVVPTITLDQKLQIAQQPGASADYIRSTAFELLSVGRKDESISLFSALAAHFGPNSSDAAQLLYLWGARISGPEMGWIVNQAASSTSQERQAGWVSTIANHAAAEDILAIAQNNPAWLRYAPFEERYVGALTTMGNLDTLNEYIISQPSSAQSVDIYHMMASRAQSQMDMKTAERALQKAAQAEPSNRETWLRMTSMYLARARYEAAEITAANAIKTQPIAGASAQAAARQEMESNFYAALLAKRKGNNDIAAGYYANAASVASRANLTDRGSLVKLYSAQMALGQKQQASQGFENLLEYAPGDAVLLADYLSPLLEQRDYMQAIDVAARHGQDVSLANAMVIADPSPLLINAPADMVPMMQSMTGGRELKLVFDRPLPNNYPLIANNQLPSWVAYTSTSYDTALIVAQNGFTLQAAQTPQGMVISAAPQTDSSAAEATRQRYLRLQLLYARLELETDAIDNALERLESLSPIYQEHPEYRAYQGNAEYYANNLTRGLNLVKRAQKHDPGNEDIRYLRRNIERFHGEHVKIDHEFRRLGDSDMNITTLEARKQFANSIEVTARYQTNTLDTAPVQRAFGGIERTDGHAWQGELSLAKFNTDSSIITGALYSNGKDLGAGLSYQFVNTLGTTNVYAEWRKPYWDVVEAVVEDASRDRIAAWHQWRPSLNWTVRGDVGYNRYHIDGKSNIADAIGVKGLVLRTLYDKQPYVAVAYGFDGEYFKGSKARNTGGAGNKLLPLRSREIHSLSGIFYYDFDQDTNAEFSAGYAIDRLGEHGPAVEGRLTHYLAEEVDMQVRARYGLEAGNTNNDALSVGGYVRWTW